MPPLWSNRDATSAKHAITRPAAPAANIHASGLALPRAFEICDGSPKTPLPIMQLMVSAARLQRPMARTSVGWLGSGIAGLYHEKGKRRTETAKETRLLFCVQRMGRFFVELSLQLEALVVGFDGFDGGH